MELFESLFWILTASCFVVLIILLLSHWLQPSTKTSHLGSQLYTGGETLSTRDRRYLETTFQYVSYFSILDILGFLLGTMFIRVMINVSIITSASITLFVVLFVSVLVLVRTYSHFEEYPERETQPDISFQIASGTKVNSIIDSPKAETKKETTHV